MTKAIGTLALVAMLALFGLATPSAAQSLYMITDLGTLPGTAGCVANGINDEGEVVGYCSGPDSFSQIAFVWRAGEMTALGRLPRGIYSAAESMRANGEWRAFVMTPLAP